MRRTETPYRTSVLSIVFFLAACPGGTDTSPGSQNRQHLDGSNSGQSEGGGLKFFPESDGARSGGNPFSDGGSAPTSDCPGGCDDGNACTFDACQNGKCVHNTGGGYDWVTFYPPGCHGYVPTGTCTQFANCSFNDSAFRLLDNLPQYNVVPDGLLYELSNGKDLMLSKDATEGAAQGYTKIADLGWVYYTARPGTVPLHRLVTATGTHYSTAKPDQEQVAISQYAMTLEASATVYVCAY